jgi:M6 family metalloprotease-like protein
MRTNLFVVLIAALLAGAAQSQSQRPQPRAWEGRVSIVAEDDFEHKTSRTRTFMEVDGEMVELDFTNRAPKLISGQTVTVRGNRKGGQIAVASVSEVYPVGNPVCQSIGELKTAVLLFDFPSGSLLSSTGLTRADLQEIFFSKTKNSVSKWYPEASYGKSWLSGDVFGPFKMSRDYNKNTYVSSLSEFLAAADATVDFSKYNRIVVVWPVDGTGWAGHAQLGCSGTMVSPTKGKLAGSIVWLFPNSRVDWDAMVEVAAHEVGHTLGLGHADWMDLAPVPLGPPGAQGTIQEYGDVYSLMGGHAPVGTVMGHFAAPHMYKLGWFGEGQMQEVESNGAFRLQPLESTASGLKAIRVRRAPDSNRWLWLEYRQPIGFDQAISGYGPQTFNGALVHYEDPDPVYLGTAYTDLTMLLDMTAAATPHEFSDAALPSGRSWSDPYGPLSIRVGAATADGLDVTVSYATPCATLSHTAHTHSLQAETGNILVYAPYGCAWTAVSAADWITITSGAGGSGAGTVAYSVAANTSSTWRTGIITVGWRTFTVTQKGTDANGLPSAVSVTPDHGMGTNPTFTFTFSDPEGYTDLIEVNMDFLQAYNLPDSGIRMQLHPPEVGMFLDDGKTSTVAHVGAAGGVQNSYLGVDSSKVTLVGSDDDLTVQLPVYFSPRAAGIWAVLGQAMDRVGPADAPDLGYWIVPPSACTYSLSSTTVDLPAAGNAASVTVTTDPGCVYLSTTNVSWILVTSPTVVTGSGTVTFYFAGNTSSSSRTGSISTGWQLVTIRQAGKSN